ncbi:MAG: hypothetical protein IJ379_10975 [Lachnospiraceae bacterium]|nr:hypothetical protein [Lachnospiraceae bacterium]
MSNFISFKDEDIFCSNGLMDVLLTAIGLSGSGLAVDEDEKNLIVWLMQRDQNRVGRGTVGFDITELPWKKEKFAQQRTFLLQVLDGARSKTGWETLDYEPNEEIVFDRIDKLIKMVSKITVEDIDEENTKEWLREDEDGSCVPKGYPKCPEHGILLSIFGCLACNDR